jgi:nucleoside-diphosphate-sugar epimerase
MAHILVTGGSGYIGSHLVSQLLERDHKVTAVDWMVFGRHPLAAHGGNPKFRLVRADVRSLKPEIINAVDVVCDLAAIHLPANSFDAAIVQSVNHLARRRLGLLAKALGVKRYLLASSVATAEAVSVDSQPERLAEQSLLALDDGEFAVTILRLGSAYGLSRRMRFDLPLNALTHEACRSGRIIVTGGDFGPEPVIHAADAASAFVHALALPVAVTRGRTFDVFCNQVSLPELARIVARTLPFDVSLAGAPSLPAGGDKINASVEASGELFFNPTPITIEQAVIEVHIALSSGRTYPSFVTRTADVYNALLTEGRLTTTQFFDPLPRRRHAS